MSRLSQVGKRIVQRGEIRVGPDFESQSAKRIAEIYDHMAQEYDEMYEPFYVNEYSAFNKCVIEPLEKENFELVVDIGCGSGLQTRRVAEQRKTRVLGVDLSRELLSIASARCRDLENVCFIAADCARLPLNGACADLVISCGEVISHVPNFREALKEISRITRPGGKVIMEVTNKWNIGLIFRIRETAEAITTSGGHIREWTYIYSDLRKVSIHYKTFSHREMQQLFGEVGLRIERCFGVHISSMLIPLPHHCPYGRMRNSDSTKMGFLSQVALALGRFDLRIAGLWPFSRIGFAKIVVAIRE